ncbi:DoxX family protein [Flavobacterium sp.]|uniref:DoxX family protein n=1 Tax=Flavobacterium sp. TaxID=239 RepID=UPI002613C3DF|nr:DoxX family protein [Flavobacterium sp.]
MMQKPILIWIVKSIAIVILLQTLFFKFSGAAESVYIFSKLGIEPFGRIGSGIVELIASVLIMIPSKSLLGAILGAGTMLGAILSHLLILGIEIKNDGGTLFILAIITFLCCLILIYNQKHKFLDLLRIKQI